jgi:hypothetical protein
MFIKLVVSFALTSFLPFPPPIVIRRKKNYNNPIYMFDGYMKYTKKFFDKKNNLFQVMPNHIHIFKKSIYVDHTCTKQSCDNDVLDDKRVTTNTISRKDAKMYNFNPGISLPYSPQIMFDTFAIVYHWSSNLLHVH